MENSENELAGLSDVDDASRKADYVAGLDFGTFKFTVLFEDGLNRRGVFYTCLLYTSPSPRDS